MLFKAEITLKTIERPRNLQKSKFVLFFVYLRVIKRFMLLNELSKLKYSDLTLFKNYFILSYFSSNVNKMLKIWKKFVMRWIE